MTSDITIIEAVSDEQRMAEYDIRWTVFVEEQQVPPVQEIDARDFRDDVTHLLALVDGKPVGTARIIPDGGGYYHLGRLAVRKEGRGLGIGAALVRAVHDHVSKLTPLEKKACVKLDAQVQAQEFYEKLGYRPTTGEVFLDAGIEHRELAVVLLGVAGD